MFEMKRVHRSIFAAVLAVLMIFSLTACKGGKNKADTKEDQKEGENTEQTAEKTDYEFFKAVIPESFKEGSSDGVFNKGDNGIIKCYENVRSAEEEIQSSLDYWEANVPGEHKDKGEKTIGAYTWRVEEFPWNTDIMSSTLYADRLDGDGSIEICIFDLSLEDPDVIAFLESFEELPRTDE